jgi:acetolactate synthase-1/2/3 large subunit
VSTLIRVADYIAQACHAAGSDHVFLVTGGGAMHLNDAFGRHKGFKAVCFHHEQAAAIAAESYCRTSNKLATLNVTTGPGGINALNGVYGAYVDSIAMLVVSGQVKRETIAANYEIPLRQLGDQEVNIISMARPIVKYAELIQDVSQVRVIIEKAVFLATNGRPGPVWIDVPVDVQGQIVNPEDLERWDRDLEKLSNDPAVTPNTKLELLSNKMIRNLDTQVLSVLARLKDSKRPLIMAGTGIRISQSYDIFKKMVAKLSIPVVTGWNAHDVLTDDHFLYAGRPGTVGDRAGNFSVQNADFLIVLGCRLNIRQISYNWKNFASAAWVVMVDIDAAELSKPTLKIDQAVKADLRDFISVMNRNLQKYKAPVAHQEYLEWCQQRVKNYPTVLPEYRADTMTGIKNKEKINPYHFIELLFKKLTKSDVIVCGNGSACVITFQAAKMTEGQRLFTNSGNASMGYDLPAAIGACIARGGEDRIICIAGDGSIMMNLQELQTVVGYALPVKIIILNNEGYHSIRQTQEAYFKDNLIGIGSDTGVTLPNFVDVAKSFKIQSKKISSIADFESEETALLLNSSKPALLEIFLDPKQPFSPKLASRKLPDGTMLTPDLDDMAPFLSRRELALNRINKGEK